MSTHNTTPLLAVTLISHIVAFSGTQAANYTKNNLPYLPQTYPHPQDDPEACGMEEKSWVCDPHGTINAHIAASARSKNPYDRIEAMLDIITETESNSERICAGSLSEGYLMAVAIVNSIEDADGLSPRQQHKAADAFAYYLRETTWKPGTCGNNILVVLAVDIQKIGVSVGPQVEKRLPLTVAQSLAIEASTGLRRENAGRELSWLLSMYRNHLLGIHAGFTPIRGFTEETLMILAGCVVGLVFLNHLCKAIRKRRKLQYQVQIGSQGQIYTSGTLAPSHPFGMWRDYPMILRLFGFGTRRNITELKQL